MGAAQALSGGITAIVIGAIYDGAGRATAYGATAIGMLVLVAAGLVLAAPFIRDRAAHTVGTVTDPAERDPGMTPV